jgi:hypothetical protein
MVLAGKSYVLIGTPVTQTLSIRQQELKAIGLITLTQKYAES